MVGIQDQLIADDVRPLLGGPPRQANPREVELGVERLRVELGSPRRGAYAGAAVVGGTLAGIGAAVVIDQLIDVLHPSRESWWSVWVIALAIPVIILAVLSLRLGVQVLRARRQVQEAYVGWWLVRVQGAPGDASRRRYRPVGAAERAGVSTALIVVVTWALALVVTVLWAIDPDEVRLVYGLSALAAVLVWGVAVWNLTISRARERSGAAALADQIAGSASR